MQRAGSRAFPYRASGKCGPTVETPRGASLRWRPCLCSIQMLRRLLDRLEGDAPRGVSTVGGNAESPLSRHLLRTRPHGAAFQALLPAKHHPCRPGNRNQLRTSLQHLRNQEHVSQAEAIQGRPYRGTRHLWAQSTTGAGVPPTRPSSSTPTPPRENRLRIRAKIRDSAQSSKML